MKKLNKEFGDIGDGTAPAANGNTTKVTGGPKRKRGMKDTAEDESPSKKASTNGSTSEDGEPVIKEETENGDDEADRAEEDDA